MAANTSAQFHFTVPARAWPASPRSADRERRRPPAVPMAACAILHPNHIDQERHGDD